MEPSSDLCRAQEKIHRDRAADTRLDNVRIVSTKAALAWGFEAVAAERREQRQDRVRLARIAAAALPDAVETMAWPSENPDRGVAAAGAEPALPETGRP